MRPLAFCIALALLAVAGGASAQQYYKWKDANGVTHYTKTPPPEGTQADRVAVNAAAPTPDPAAAGTAPKADAGTGMSSTAAQQRSAACQTAQANLDTLQNNPFVSIDKDGDGKPELLTVEEHNAQLAIAREQVRTLCPAQPGG
jgi:hypothetical protein